MVMREPELLCPDVLDDPYPTLAALRQAVDALEDMNMRDQVQLIISGGKR